MLKPTTATLFNIVYSYIGRRQSRVGSGPNTIGYGQMVVALSSKVKYLYIF
jgi:hypothetical protein